MRAPWSELSGWEKLGRVVLWAIAGLFVAFGLFVWYLENPTGFWSAAGAAGVAASAYVIIRYALLEPLFVNFDRLHRRLAEIDRRLDAIERGQRAHEPGRPYS